MKILYLSASDIIGGAAKGAYRLHRGFLKHGIESTMLVANKSSEDTSVLCLSRRLRKKLNFRRRVIRQLLKLQQSDNTIIHSTNYFRTGIIPTINSFNADIVQLHWVGGEFIGIPDISNISAPIVWRLADQWLFCGAEHYTLPNEDSRYRDGYLKYNKPAQQAGIDINRIVWNRKMRYLQDKPMTIITGSNWLANCARESKLLGHQNIEVIPSGIDTIVFKPINKKASRDALNLPDDKKIILFGAMSATSDQRKGFSYFMEALKLLSLQPIHKDIELVVFGAKEKDRISIPNYKIHYFPHIHDEITLSLFYSSADVFVAPSIQDNLPFSVMEAMACGCPSVAFDIGGLPDLIDHKKNGYLAKPFSVEDLVQGMLGIIQDEEEASRLSEYGINKARRVYDLDVQVKSYLKVYENLLR